MYGMRRDALESCTLYEVHGCNVWQAFRSLKSEVMIRGLGEGETDNRRVLLHSSFYSESDQINGVGDKEADTACGICGVTVIFRVTSEVWLFLCGACARAKKTGEAAHLQLGLGIAATVNDLIHNNSIRATTMIRH